MCAKLCMNANEQVRPKILVPLMCVEEILEGFLPTALPHRPAGQSVDKRAPACCSVSQRSVPHGVLTLDVRAQVARADGRVQRASRVESDHRTQRHCIQDLAGIFLCASNASFSM